jgi:hypothetical protein
MKSSPFVARVVTAGGFTAVGDNTLGAKVYQDFALTDDAVISSSARGCGCPKLLGLSKSRCPAPNSHRCWPSCRRRLRR